MMTISGAPIRLARLRIISKHLLSRVCTTIIAALAILCVPSAQASIEFYRVGKRIGYNQIDNTQPTTPAGMDGGVDMFSSNPEDFTSARVFSTSPVNPSPISPFVLTQFSPGYWGSSQVYPSLAEMDTNLPPGDTFGFLVEGGTLGPQLALVDLPSTDLFAPQVPYFTNNAFTQLNGMNPSAPFTLMWNGYTPVPGTNDSPIFLNVYRVSDGQSMTGTVVANTVTSFQIPANTLEPGVTYRASLDYSSRKNTIDAGFTDADSGVTYDLVTELQFTAGAAQIADPPGDYNDDGAVDAADYVTWRKNEDTVNSLPNDPNGGTIDAAQFDTWRTYFGHTAGSGTGASANAAVPEPATFLLLMFGVAGWCLRRRRAA
jgi:hypothetical protein